MCRRGFAAIAARARACGAWPWRHKALALAATAVAGACAATALLWPMDLAPYQAVATSPEMLDRDGQLLYAFLNEDDQWCFKRPISTISPKLLEATVAIEDQRFYRHHGVDPVAVARAAWQNVSGGRIASGASTITMQLVKQVQRHPRTFAGKAWQAVEALRLDMRMPKSDILEAYLNTAPYGQNMLGCEAASRRYFGKPASELTLSEAALLAGLPKAPSALMPLEHPDRALARRNHVLHRMREEGFITGPEYDEARRRPLGVAWHDYPGLAPHLAVELAPKARQAPIVTTLDAAVQDTAERLLAQRIARFNGDITNGAVIVVDVASGDILARAGSADYFDTPGGGMFDACRAARSPGSALKPFTYGLAMEQQQLYPTEMLLDDALDYGRYNPVNYDRNYSGLIAASEALQRSLNVPAVAILERLGEDALQDLLTSMELATVNRPGDYYGLGLTLGNCEVRLTDMIGAYLAIARLGEFRRPNILRDATTPPAKRILSTETCAALYEMLAQPLPAEFEYEAVRSAGIRPRVAWKTGTSSGNRDAWAFVFNRHYLVGVWMGNNDGAGSPRLVGASAALPLAGRLFRNLPQKTTPAWPDTASYTRTAELCAVSGLPASDWCRRTRHDAIPANQYLHRICDMHYPSPAGEPLERWPGAARGWDLAAIDRSAPQHAAEARSVEALRILEPADHAEYVLTGEPQGDRIRLRASVDHRAPVHWYADDRYIGKATSDDPILFDLTAGEHRLTCLSPSGAHKSVTIQVHRPDSPVRLQ